MLMGRAHHVIYFASAERWIHYPEWVRHVLSRQHGRGSCHAAPGAYALLGVVSGLAAWWAIRTAWHTCRYQLEDVRPASPSG